MGWPPPRRHGSLEDFREAMIAINPNPGAGETVAGREERVEPVVSAGVAITAPTGQDRCDVSFIIVSWNAKNLLRECLESLKAATGGLDAEIIIVDNASTDGSVEMVRDGFKDVLLLQNNFNAGFAQANNQGIAIARGNYLCLVNSDVHVFPDSIKNILDYMKLHSDVGMLGPKALNRDGSRQTTCRTVPTLRSSFFRALALDTTFPNSSLFGSHFMTNWNYDETREVDILGGCFWMIRRPAIEQVGLLDTRFFMYGEDMDFCRRFHSAGWKVIFHPGAQITHYGGGSSANAPARFWVEMQRANLQYWIKHRGRVSVLSYYCCLLLYHGVRVAGLSARGLVRRGTSDSSQATLEKNRRGLNWLLAPSTIMAVLRCNVSKLEEKNA
jgi:GT2 family glycosyltransferase